MGALHTLVTSALVGAASSARTTVGAAELALRRAPALVSLGARATVATGADAARAQAVFRDGLLTLFDDLGELAWREARRARIQLDGPLVDRLANALPAREHRQRAEVLGVPGERPAQRVAQLGISAFEPAVEPLAQQPDLVVGAECR